jgi:hypothetical protein
MKKLLFFLLLSSIVDGQNIELMKTLNNSDEAFTKEFSQRLFEGYKIIPASKQDSIDRKHSNIIIYKLEKESDPQSIVSVKFKWMTKNGNSDLKIPGEKYFIFEEALGEFLELFPFWHKEVEPKSTTDKTYENRPVYTYKNKEDKIWFNFWRVGSTWMMRNESERSSDDW